MHFVSQKADATVDYIEFYRTKFPLAFKRATNEDESEFEWTDKAIEKRFAKFDEELTKCAKEKHSALALLNTLDSYKDVVI
jgi:hypothetical protein